VTYEQKPNSGSLFKNDKGDNPARPDYKGSLNVEGVDGWLSAWLKKSKEGKAFMSLSWQPKDQQAPASSGSATAQSSTKRTPPAQAPAFVDDDIDAVPF
jgi:hypothetical protein